MSDVTLSHAQARQTYDRIGKRQDTQWFYEDRATTLLRRHADFASAERVFEFGCGTGRFAQTLFEQHLSATARYRGVDISPEMVRLARSRLAPYAERAEVVQSEGGAPVGEPDACCDRFVSNYVFDLLSHDDIAAVLREARRMLQPQGLLCLSGLSTGAGRLSDLVARGVRWVQSRRPALVGGCRPVDLPSFLGASEWEVRHQAKVVAWGIPSQVVVARRR